MQRGHVELFAALHLLYSRSQLVKGVIEQRLSSGVARTLPLLGNSMGTLHLYKLQREVQKLLGESGWPRSQAPT